MFWSWPEAGRGTLPEAGWARVVPLTIAAGQGLPEHAAPADMVLVCVAGSIRFIAAGEEQLLLPGDGVTLARGAAHAVVAGEAGRAILLLRQAES